MYIPRLLTSRLLRLLDVFPVVVVSGARQVGKSTLLQEVLGGTWSIVVFDPVVDVENARLDPELFLANRLPPLILDEIQYAPELVPAIKRLVDRDRRPGQYVITGSQRWEVMRDLAESLAGRAGFLDLEGFSLTERANTSDLTPWFPEWLRQQEACLAGQVQRLPLRHTLYELLWRGSLPDACLLPLDVIADFHLAYQRTYIERDVRLLAQVSDSQLFGRFLRLCGALTAQEINYSQLGRELGLTPQTSARWLDILKATFQWFELSAWSGNTIKRVSSRPKGYLADTGLACAAQSISTPHAIGNHPLQGALFETAVVGEIRRQCGLLSPRPRMYHWRSHRGAEVDVVVEYDGVLFPVEIKLKSRPSKRDTSGITAFRKTYPGQRVASGLVVCPTEGVLRLNDRDWAVPWDLGIAAAT
ncbi:MAG: ATP-binding protein [Proteobacteria bacterium]|jgi:uncharacterized protein|nr:ATP-binding protein [Pseudomonadota bacterium]